MFGQGNNADEILPYLTDFNFQFQYSNPNIPLTFPSSSSPPPPLAIPTCDFDSFPALRSELSHSSSGCSSFNSPTSYGNCNYYGSPSSLTTSPINAANYHDQNLIMQKSISSHSLLKNGDGFSAVVTSPPPAYADMDASPVRKVFSTGDIQGMNLKYQSSIQSESPLKQELRMIEDMSKACKYTQEEKKERIERYRNKRNQRNFNKKIKYECRKTLADSRPRIRGRFARNDEVDKNSPNQWDQAVVIEEDEEDEENWISLLMQYQQI